MVAVGASHAALSALMLITLLFSQPSRAQDLPAVNDLPFIEAARAGDVETMEQYVLVGSTIDQLGYEGKSALHIAAEWNQPAAVNFLIENGAKIDKRARDRHTALTYAVLRQRDIIVDALLAAGADPNRDGYNYETPLITAVRLNNKTMVKALLAANADPMISDSTGRDAFDWARQGRGQDMLALLNQAAAR